MDVESLDDSFKFLLKEQYWYISFITKINDELEIKKRCKEIEYKIMSSIKNITDIDLQYLRTEKEKSFCKKFADKLVVKCNYKLLTDFEYQEMKNLGYFIFHISFDELVTDDLRAEIRPPIIQTITYKASDILNKNFSDTFSFDFESPLLVFSIACDYSIQQRIKWTDQKINKYKKELGKWIVLYSGQWSDYAERLYDERITDQLSNRTSELHYISRNSGFIYMDEENYTKHFQSYMKQKVLNETIEMRTVLFSLVTIEKLLNDYHKKFYEKEFEDKNLKEIEDEMEVIDNLKIKIDNIISDKLILLSYNLRQHYSAVIRLLLDKYRIEENFNRVTRKFNEILKRLDNIQTHIAQINSKKQEQALNILNLILGFSVIVELLSIILTDDLTIKIVNSIFLGIVALYFIFYLVNIISTRKYNTKRKLKEV